MAFPRGAWEREGSATSREGTRVAGTGLGGGNSVRGGVLAGTQDAAGLDDVQAELFGAGEDLGRL